MRRIFLGLLLACGAVFAQSAPTIVNIGSAVKQSGVKHFGINLSFLSFWDSGQMMKNLVFRNPGFEPMLYQSVMRCATGSSTSFTDEVPWSTWTTGFWNGASYELVRSGATVRTGTVVNFIGPSGSTGSTYQFDTSGVTPVAGDLIIVRKRFPGGSTHGWAVNQTAGGAAIDEVNDLPPGTTGVQCVRLSASSPGASVNLANYFDSTAGRTFVQLVGPHRVSFMAKGVGGNNQLTISVGRTGLPNALYQTITLSPSWNSYNIDFTGNDTGSSVGTVAFQLSVQGGSALIDDVSLAAQNTDPTNTTVYRDAVVRALKTLQPGILRYWGSQLGDSLDNQLATPQGRKPSGYSAYTNEQDNLAYGLHEFLQLCQATGAEPWYVVPIVTSPAEAAQLIDYLAGSTATIYGAKRAALGQAAPWTSVFPKIHLEFGNEAWNSIFKGGTIEYPDAYGSRAQTIFGAMRGNPSFSASNFDLILGGQYDDVGRTVANSANCTNHDTVSLAPYISSTVDNYSTNEDLFGPLFAEPQYVSQQGYLWQEFSQISSSARPVPIAVYETNLGTVGGAIPQNVLDQFTPSLGAGVAMASHMLTMLQNLGIKNQNLYALPQYQFLRPDGKQAKLWGSVVDMGVTDRRRPQYLALQLINQALSGNLLTTSLTNAPTWNQPYENGIQFTGANYVQAFAFQNGTQNSLVLINLHRSSALPVTFSGAVTPSGSVTYSSLQGSAPTLTNEDAQNVNLSSQTLSNFNSAANFSLPPYSVNVLSWSASGTTTTPPPPPPPTTFQISNISVTGITNWGATVNWTTSTPATTYVQYGTTAAYGSATLPSPYLTTQHSILIPGLANGTTYNAKIISTDSLGNSVSSTNITFVTLDLIPPAISNISAIPGAATQSGTPVTFSWTTDKPSTSQVQYGPTSAYGSMSPVGTSLVTAHAITIANFAPGSYHYRVLSNDASGNQGVSVDIALTIAGNVPPPSPPPAISYLSAWNITASSALVTWTTDRPSSSTVTYATNSSLGGAYILQDPTLVTQHSLNLIGLTDGTTYYFTVASADANGLKGASSVLSFSTPSTSPPVVSNVSVVITAPGTASVTWTTNKPADGQVQYGATTNYGMWSAWNSAMTTQHQATLQWLPSGTNYFCIRSRDANGLLTVTTSYPFYVP